MAKAYAKSFYESESWQSTRKAYLSYIHMQCERCGAPAKIVHHKKHISPSNINNTNITLAFDNLEALCQDCHNKHHRGGFTNNRYCIDKNGEIHPHCK